MVDPAPLDGRYRFLRTLSGGAASSWLAVDTISDRTVVVGVLPVARIAGLAGVVNLPSPHLAKLLDVVHEPNEAELPESARARGVAVAVAEYFEGPTIHDRIARASLEKETAVACILAATRAVNALQSMGGIHGAINPKAVVVEPEGRDGPVLLQLAAASNASYCSPERLDGGGPSGADDVWALHATLYAALTGRAPFLGKSRAALLEKIESGALEPLSSFGVDSEPLWLVLQAGLRADPSSRQCLATVLEEQLLSQQEERPLPLVQLAPRDDMPTLQMDRFLASGPIIADRIEEFEDGDRPSNGSPEGDENGGATRDATPPSDEKPTLALDIGTRDDSQPAFARHVDLDEGSQPELLLRRTAATRAARTAAREGPSRDLAAEAAAALGEIDAKRRRGRWVVFSGMLVVAGGLGGAGYWYWQQRALRPKPAPVVTASAPATSASAAAPPQPREPPKTAEQRADCIRAHFPAGSFRKTESFEFVCAKSDFRAIKSLLHRRLVVGGSGVVSDGMKSWANLGWFELPALAVIQRSCCKGDLAIDLPKEEPPCESLGTVLEGIARDDEKPAEELGTRYQSAVTCLYETGTAPRYGYEYRPTASARKEFEAMLARAREYRYPPEP